MKKIIYTLIAAFVACTAVAQTPSAYFMEGSTFRSQLNPAFAPLRGYVNIPVLGGVQVNVSGNLSVSDIFFRGTGGLAGPLTPPTVPASGPGGVFGGARSIKKKKKKITMDKHTVTTPTE